MEQATRMMQSFIYLDQRTRQDRIVAMQAGVLAALSIMDDAVFYIYTIEITGEFMLQASNT